MGCCKQSFSLSVNCRVFKFLFLYLTKCLKPQRIQNKKKKKKVNESWHFSCCNQKLVLHFNNQWLSHSGWFVLCWSTNGQITFKAQYICHRMIWKCLKPKLGEIHLKTQFNQYLVFWNVGTLEPVNAAALSTAAHIFDATNSIVNAFLFPFDCKLILLI